AFLADDVHAQFDAFIADEYGRPGDEFAHFMLALAAERAIERIFGVAFGLGHRFSPFRPLPPKRVVKRPTKQPNQTTLTKRSLDPASPSLLGSAATCVNPGSDKQPPNRMQNQGRRAKIIAAEPKAGKNGLDWPKGYAFTSSNSRARLTVTSST